LRAAIEPSIRHFHGHEEEILVDRHIALAARADHRSHQCGVCRIGDVVDIYSIKIALKEVIALEGEVGVGECELGDRQLNCFGKFRDVADAELADCLLHFGIVGIGCTELEGVGLFEQEKMPDAQ
jgi:hypothetical protein